MLFWNMGVPSFVIYILSCLSVMPNFSVHSDLRMADKLDLIAFIETRSTVGANLRLDPDMILGCQGNGVASARQWECISLRRSILSGGPRWTIIRTILITRREAGQTKNATDQWAQEWERTANGTNTEFNICPKAWPDVGI